MSGFALAEASTAILWGTISDKYGRKPIVLSGLAGVALSSLIFGVAQNYWVALAARVVGGLLNGNVSVMQTMVAEMVKNPKHERTSALDLFQRYTLIHDSARVQHDSVHVVLWLHHRIFHGWPPRSACRHLASI